MECSYVCAANGELNYILADASRRLAPRQPQLITTCGLVLLRHPDRNEYGSSWHIYARSIAIVVAMLAEWHNPCIIIWAILTVNSHMGAHKIGFIRNRPIGCFMQIYCLALTRTRLLRLFLPILQEGIIAIRDWFILRIKDIMHRSTFYWRDFYSWNYHFIVSLVVMVLEILCINGGCIENNLCSFPHLCLSIRF